MGMNHKKNKGFTLIEVMIALAIIGIVMGSAYSIMDSQRKAATTQSEVVDMQQSLRAAMYYMERDIRLAGFPSDPARVTGTGVIEAGPGHIHVAMDIFGGSDISNGNPINGWEAIETASPGTVYGNGTVTELNEDITYGFDPNKYDNLGVGLVDAGKSPVGTDQGAAPLGRADNNNPPPPALLNYVDMAESVEAIGFAYAFDDDDDGQLDVGPTGSIIWAVDIDGDGQLDTNLDTNGDGFIGDGSIDKPYDIVGGVALATPVSIANIRAVQVWLLARSKHRVPEFTETRTFVVGNKHITPNDQYLRRLLTSTIRLRN
jgi:type IV pilus assembly protein PilW